MMLLKRLLPAHDHEALLGDLHEERRRGRSLLWYGSQILAALVVGSWRDVRKHPILAMRGIATGLLALKAYFAIIMAIARVVTVLSNGGYYVGGYWLTLPLHPIPERYGVLMVFLINSFGFALSGWAVVRLHRAYGLAMAMPYLSVMSLLSLVPLTVIVMDAGPGTRTMPLVQVAWIVGSLFASIPGGVLLGGILGARTAGPRVTTST